MIRHRRYLAECIGTAILLCTVVGSGIMAENLSAGNGAVALIANTLATMFVLYVLIEIMGPISGAHFNPAVSLVMACRKELSRRNAFGYILAQLLGAALGVWLAHAMFNMELFHWSTKVRTGHGQWLAEVVATAGLLLVILRAPSSKASSLVACYIGAAYWFTASTSFANPAAVFGRMMSNSFSGISPADAPGFITAELVGALIGWILHIFLNTYPQHPKH